MQYIDKIKNWIRASSEENKEGQMIGHHGGKEMQLKRLMSELMTSTKVTFEYWSDNCCIW